LAAILDDIAPVAGEETVDCEAAFGRIAVADITAPISLPPFRASAMDGYALHSADASSTTTTSLAVIGTSSAGHPFVGHVPRGTCVRIFTGAAVPDDLDAVAIQEEVRRDGHYVTLETHVGTGDNIRPAGHDIIAGAAVVGATTRIGEFQLAWLAACGVTQVRVRRRPRVAIFSTGDELREPGQTLAPGQIFDANRYALRNLLAALPLELIDLGILPDDRPTLDRVLAEAGERYDAVLTSGGVSVGDADFVKQAVARTGAIRFWRLNLKPGKPLAYGRLGNAVFLGLPGNPVSTIVTALLIAMPALQKLAGTQPNAPLMTTATLEDAIRHRPGREEYQRGWLSNAAGRMTVSVPGDQSSNRLASFASANCLVRIPKDASDLVPGTPVSVLPFRGLL
jgi:molybdopterin molybdotransferase